MSEDRLAKARAEINEADREMARLFEKRMAAAREIAAYKREKGLPILDAERERQVIRQNQAMIRDDSLRDFYVRFLQDVMDISKAYQHRLMQGIRAAYSGVEGAFAYIAARRIFPDGEAVACDDFQAAYRAVETGDCDVCVLPLENSYAGEVGQVTDLMFQGPLQVTGIFTLPVTHHLLGVPGAALSQVRRVVSHPQALSQCAGYIRRHQLESVQASNTARAAQQVLEAGDPATAAIASMETAQLYGLQVLEKSINESGLNTTRFAVFSQAENLAVPKGEGSFLLLFTVNHVAGALANAIQVIGRHGFNMRVLRSRPMKELPWHYYFFAEMEGDDRSQEGQSMMRELAEHCNFLKVAGRFAAEISLKEAEA